LSGDFTKGEIAGIGTTGSAMVSTDAGSTIHFSSDISGALKGLTRDLVLDLSAISPSLGASAGAALHTFLANADGEFDQAVPEPATWIMLILGMGALGAASRRRRAIA